MRAKRNRELDAFESLVDEDRTVLAQMQLSKRKTHFIEFLKGLDQKFVDHSIGSPIDAQVDNEWVRVRQTNAYPIPGQNRSKIALKQTRFLETNDAGEWDNFYDLVALNPYEDSPVIARSIGGLRSIHPNDVLWTPQGEVDTVNSLRSLIILTNYVLEQAGVDTYRSLPEHKTPYGW